MKSNVVILPVNKIGNSRTSTVSGLTAKEVEALIGFPANCDDDAYKVKYSWGFTVNGVRCGVWDYKGSHEFNQFSAWGPLLALKQVFGNNVR
jgi:hypothetical protein